MAADGYDPLPSYTRPQWQEQAGREEGETERKEPLSIATGNTPLVAPRRSPLVCISPPAHSFLNTTFANALRFIEREVRPVLRIHPDDAAARGIEDGNQVRVCNELGEVHLAAAVTAGLMPGTVLAPGVWWAKFSPDGRNINQITSSHETDMGASARFYDTVVWVEKIIT